MKFNISREKLKTIIQTLIDREIKVLKTSQELGEEPDDVSSSTIDDIHTIESIKITDIDSLPDILTNEQIYFCEVFVTYDSAARSALDVIVYDIQERIQKMIGVKVKLTITDIYNKYLDYGQI